MDIHNCVKNSTSFLSENYLNSLQVFLKQSKELFISLSNNFEILEINPAAIEFYEISEKNPIGKKCFDFIGRDSVLCELLRKIKSFCSTTNSRLEQPYLGTSNFQGKNIQWSITGLFNQGNEIINIVLIGHDLSKKEAAVQKSKDALFSLETMIAHLPGNVYWMDTNCIHLGCNDNVLKMLGITREQYIGRTYEELAKIVGWTDGEAESFKRDDLEVLRTGIPKFNIEEPPIRHKDGKVVYYLTTRVPMRNEAGQVVGVAGISIDITERKIIEANLKEAKEKAEAAAKAKAQFLANISHDFITLLSIILSGTNAIASLQNNEDKKLEYCNDIISTANILIGYVQDILETAKVEYTNMPINEELFSIPELVNDIIHTFMIQAEKKNTKINSYYDANCYQNIICDRHRTHRILINLLANAIKFTDSGQIDLRFSITKDNEFTGKLHISVIDSGIGIPQEKLGIIFEPFTRLQPAYHGHYKGIGLGLSIVRELIKQLNGHIFVESEEGAGTTFHCEIACKFPADEQKNAHELNNFQTHENENLANNQTPNLIIKDNSENPPLDIQVLLIEDELMIQKFTKIALAGLGCQITLANNGKEAIQFATTYTYDLILLDIGLPDYDAVDVIHAIRAHEKNNNLKSQPIIALTAHADEAKKEACFEAGLDIFCKKPFQSDDFLQLCKQLGLNKN